MKKRKRVCAVMVLAMVMALFAGGAVLGQDLRELDDPVSDAPLLDEGVTPEERNYEENEELSAAVRANEAKLKAIDGVTAVMGMDMDGLPTIVVFVEEGADTAEIPAEIDGFPVFVEEDAEVTIMPYTAGEEGAEDGIADDSAETVETISETEEEDEAGISIYIYVVGAALIILIIIALVAKKK